MQQLEQAACSEIDGDVFFPAPFDHAAIAAAKRACARCPVRLECLALALQAHDLDGIWGGLTARERVRYTKRHRPTATRQR